MPAKTHLASRADHPHYREYCAWLSAKGRCFNPRNARYPLYGGRGITMADAWRHSFETFLKDMGPRPPKRSLDRWPDNDGPYAPGNCRWATQSEQCLNKRHPKLGTPLKDAARPKVLELRALGWPTRKIAKEVGCSQKTVMVIIHES